MPVKRKVMIADDHKIMREGLCTMFSRSNAFDVVGEAQTGKEAVEMALLKNPDIIIMDIRFPDISGVVATREILVQRPKTVVIALSMHADRHYVVEIMRAGAMAFLLKDCAFSELVEAIKSSLEGRKYFSQAVTGIVVEDVMHGTYPDAPPVLARLTDREIAVLKMMVEGAPAKTIGRSMSIAPTTVATHQQRLKRKLGMFNIVELTKLAIREGLIPLTPGEALPHSAK